MADKSISELVAATSIGSTDLFVLEQTGTAKKLTGQILENWLVSYADGHGGIQSLVKTSSTGTNPVIDTYTITYADTTTSTFTVTNGLKGDTGDQTYVWIKYAAQYPTSDSDMGTSPDDWIGIYSGTSSTAPTHYTDYVWFEWKGEQGDTGDPAELDNATINYQQSNSGTTVPTGTWSDTVPSPVGGMYLWTRVVLSFNTGDPVTYYSVSRYGIDGTGAVNTVNNILPDVSGNVLLTADDIQMDNGDTVEEYVAGTKNAVFIGDSYVQANSLSPQSSRFSTVLSGLLGVTEYNYAIGGSDWLAPSGSTFLAQLNNANNGMTEAQKQKTKYVFICGGRNVPYNTPSYTYAQLKAAMETCNARATELFPNAQIVLVPVLWDSVALNTDYTEFLERVETACYEIKFNGFYIKDAYTWLQGYSDCILSDGVHPNASGHQIIATNIYNALNGNFHYKPFQEFAIQSNGLTARVKFMNNIVFIQLNGTPSVDLAFGAYAIEENLGQHSGLVTRLQVHLIAGTRSGVCYPFQVQFQRQDNGDVYLKIQYLGNTLTANSDSISSSMSLINGL